MGAVSPHDRSTAIPAPIPHGRTARRLGWSHLPPSVRRAVERRLGARVVGAASCDAGYTPGLASVLTCDDGSRHFIKAASTKAQRLFAQAYREEARKLRLLPPTTPAPRLRWVEEGGDWVVLGLEYVEGRLPERPWTDTDLAAASAALVETASVLTPAPGIGLTGFAEEFADYPAYWGGLDLPRRDEAAELAAGFAAYVGGETLVHTDIRDDNLLVRPDGSVVVLDWNWPVVGADWIDSLLLLIGPRGDGLDVEAHLAEHPLLSRVEPEAIDSVLALVAGYFLDRAQQPRPRTSPYLRAVQQWQGEVCWRWLSERRGWS